ncbi:MAG: hypothetical protein AAGH38_07195, partial [Pseudomonadota bacterium]
MYLSKLSKEFRHRLRQYSYPLVQRRNCGTFAVRIHSSVGFFAQLNQVVRVLAYFNEKGLRARIILTSPLYVARDGDNWFEYFFDPTSTDGDPLPPDASLSFTNVGHIKDLGWPSLADIGIGLYEANRLFGRYATLKADIASHVRSFIDNDLVGKTLGVHFRGTDKISEAPRVRRETIASAIRAHLQEYPETETVFVASDEGPFIDWATDEFRDLRVISHPDAIAPDGVGVRDYSQVAKFICSPIDKKSFVTGDEHGFRLWILQ